MAVNRASAGDDPGQWSSPVLSIVTPSFNHAAYIRATIESVLQQDFASVEHIVVDGGSTDGTVEILREYGDQYPERFRWVSEPDQGQSDALNKGVGMARGQIIGWQNSDDVYLPNVFSTPLAYLTAHSDVTAVYGQREDRYPDGSRVVIGWGPLDYHRLLLVDIVPSQAVFFRRDAFMAVGGVSLDLHYAMDYDLWLRLGLRGRFHFMHGVWGVWNALPNAKTVADYWRSCIEHMTAVERLLDNPALPVTLRPDVQCAIQRHAFLAIVETLKVDRLIEAGDILPKVVRADSPHSIWPELCGQLLLWRVTFEAMRNASFRAKLSNMPSRMLALMAESGIADTRQAGDLSVLHHVFRALDALGSGQGRRAIFHAANGIKRKPLWLAGRVLRGVCIPTFRYELQRLWPRHAGSY